MESNGVSFNEEVIPGHALPPRPRRSAWSPMGIVLATGIARTERGANYLLAVVALLAIAAAVGVYIWSTRPVGTPPASLDLELHEMHAVGH